MPVPSRFGDVVDQPPAVTTGEMKELRRWNAPKREGGMNANGYEEFPRMLYKAQIHPLSGKFEALATSDVLSLDKTVVMFSAEEFNRTCQLTVGNGDELERAVKDGWCTSPAEARAAAEKRLDGIAQAAAERAYDDRRMSEKARAEAERADAASPDHLPEIKERPRRGRPQNPPAA